MLKHCRHLIVVNHHNNRHFSDSLELGYVLAIFRFGFNISKYI